MTERYVIGAAYRDDTIPADYRGFDVELPKVKNIDVELLGQLAVMQEVLQAGGENDSNFLHTLEEARLILVGIMRASNPAVPENIGMGIAEALEIMYLILEGKTAAQEIAAGLTDAVAEGESEGDFPAAEAVAEGSEQVPLSGRSKKRSATSARRTTGARSTGKGSRGASSASSSAKRAAA